MSPRAKLRLGSLALASWAGFVPMVLSAQNGSSVHAPPRAVVASESPSPIELDGLLAEPAWRDALPATGFVQTQPDEGEPATQRTEVRFIFDVDAVYVGARMYDDLGSAGITTRLVRRDGHSNSDLLTIVFDTFHDHLGRTSFSINPAGVKSDALGPGGAWPDPSWDPVWQAATQIDSLGWTAELRIPFSQLRFPQDSVQTWGLQVERFVSRLNEYTQWAFWRSNESGGPSRYGHLERLALTGSPNRLEVLPYVVGRSSNLAGLDPDDPFRSPHQFDQRFGADVKYSLTSNLTLTATVNPDFGQVEVDPAVVNLSDFETYFPERRPFFVEGRGFLRFGGLNCYFCSNTSGLSLFYSRRIGRAPQGASNAHDAGDYAEVPENTTILGAAKVTGRTAGGWTVGAFDALTSRERGRSLGSEGALVTTEVEPLTNYFVGRVARDLKDGNLVIGGMATSVVRNLADPTLEQQLSRHAEAVGLESNWWWGQRTYRLMTSWAVSQVGGEPSALLRLQHASARYLQRPDRQHGANGLFTDRLDSSLTMMRGFAGYTRLSKESGDWLWEINTNVRSPGFEVNDMAFLTRADYVWMSANVFRRWTVPTRVYRRLAFIAGGQQQYNFDGDLTDRQMQGWVNFQARNYWDFYTFYIHRPEVWSDRLTRGGPVVQRPSRTAEPATGPTTTRPAST
jgi:hypothetical protein